MCANNKIYGQIRDGWAENWLIWDPLVITFPLSINAIDLWRKGSKIMVAKANTGLQYFSLSVSAQIFTSASAATN